MDTIKDIMLQDDLMETLLRYGLFLGAIFQIICIGAVVIIPDYKSDYLNESEGSEDEPGSDQGSPTHTSLNHRHPRSSKREKKKRR